MADDGSQRVGDAERMAAIEALNGHWRAGRLDPTEHERRTTRAYAAVTQNDLDSLFVDLPSGRSTRAVSPAAPSAAPRGRSLFPEDSWVGRWRGVIMGIVPLVTIGLFFLTYRWQWFLVVPVLGALLYAGDDRGRRGDRGGC